MEKRFVIVFIAILMLMTSCGNDTPNELDIESLSEPKSEQIEHLQEEHIDHQPIEEEWIKYQFPDSVNLKFQPVVLTELQQVESKETWEHKRTIAFGAMKSEPVYLQVYKNNDPTAFCDSSYQNVVLLEHNGQLYGYEYCFSSSLLDYDEPDQHAALFVLGYTQKDGDSNYILHGATELSANGPSRMLFYYYDTNQNRWYGFENWGIPQLVDLDGSGADELVIEFPGLHLHWPDIYIYRWNNGVLERTDSLKGILQVPNYSMSSAELNEKNGEYILEIQAVLGSDFDQGETAQYKYTNGELVRIPYAEGVVNHSSAISPNGKYLIESFGINKNVSAGGLYPAEGIRLVDTDSDQVLWTVSPGYYSQSYLWSPNSRYVAISFESRIWGGTYVVDAQDGTEIILPAIGEVRQKWDGETTVNTERPDPYYKAEEWLDSSNVKVSFQWAGLDDVYYSGNYVYDVQSRKLLQLIIRK